MNPTSGELVGLLAILAERSQKNIAELLAANYDELSALLEHHASTENPLRWQDAIILEHIAPGATVLDLGCGAGDLLLALAAKGVHGQGVELDAEEVMRCVERAVPVIQADLDRGLAGFADDSLDVVVCEETLQTLHRPVAVLEEMLRVGRRAIVSFPNFGHWRIRLDLALRGRMPSSHRLPHRWYDTPNIHLFTITDFLMWVAQQHCRIDGGWVLADGSVRAITPGDNLRAEEALFIVAAR